MRGAEEASLILRPEVEALELQQAPALKATTKFLIQQDDSAEFKCSNVKEMWAPVLLNNYRLTHSKQAEDQLMMMSKTKFKATK